MKQSLKDGTIQKLKALVKDLHESIESNQYPFRFRSLVRSNGDESFALNDTQAETYLSFLDDRADFELNATLQALNFFASLVYIISRVPALSRHCNNSPEAELLCYFGSKLQGSQWVGLRFMDTFDPRKMTKDKDIELSFRKASEIFGNSGNKLASRLQSAIKWAGKASVTQNRENAFVFYSVALEALLLGQQHQEQLAYKLRLRAAHLLGFSNSARSDIRDRVNKLYGIRSKIVHSGTMEIAQSDLDELRIITQSCIICILSHLNFQNINSEAELDNWFEERLIYGPEK